jgi:microcystin-dependent protein
MSQPYIGEIRMFGGNFAPAGWMLCQGQTIPISENDALFTLIGTTYGGDGQENFALPDLQGRTPMHVGSGFILGQTAGVESVTLTVSQMPIHNHFVAAATSENGSNIPSQGTILADEGPPGQSTVFTYRPFDAANPVVQLSGASIGISGGNQPHENRQPLLAINFIISLFGIFPSQN